MPEQDWIATVPAERFAGERLYAFETLTLDAEPAGAGSTGAGSSGAEPTPAVGDRVALVALSEPPVLFGLARVRRLDPLTVRYTHRLFDEPRELDAPGAGLPALPVPPASVVPPAPAVRPLPAGAFARLAELVGDDGARPVRQSWFVTVALPIEAASRAEAVREFWTYVAKLGPRELPAFVWPLGDELAMQAFVLGEVANLDPEEDE